MLQSLVHKQKQSFLCLNTHLYVLLRVSPFCSVEGKIVAAVVWTTGQCSLPTCTSEKCVPQHDGMAKKTNISEEAFVTQSWMEMAWSHNTALNCDRTGKLCDSKWTYIHEEVDKLTDKSLLRIYSMFFVVHQYQYDTILIVHKKTQYNTITKRNFSLLLSCYMSWHDWDIIRLVRSTKGAQLYNYIYHSMDRDIYHTILLQCQ